MRTLSGLIELKQYLEDKDFIAFDTETTGTDRSSEIIGFSVAAEADVGYYVILSYWNNESQKLEYLETREGAKEFMSFLASKNLIMHNAVFDCSMVLNNYGVDLMPSVHTDTMILGHLLNENRLVGLKERGEELYGESAKKEQLEMKESVAKNGGSLTKSNYELYKADAELIAKYGAKDAILTFKLFCHDLEDLFNQGLNKFFYEDESMPQLKGPTYDLNTTGLRVDPDKLVKLKGDLEAECLDAITFILREVHSYVSEEYPGTSKSNKFNIGSGAQIAWLLFIKLENEFATLTASGKEICKALGLKTPYTASAKREFLRQVNANVGQTAIVEAEIKRMKQKDGSWRSIMGHKNVTIRAPKYYLSADEDALTLYAKKYKWVQRLLEYKKAQKLLSTYVEGIQERTKYGVIRPSFLQHGTTSGRYSSRNPNFQNLPRNDKRVKECIISRPGKVFVGADYSQLEPRIFASLSGDERLIKCFEDGDDFYAVIGIEVFDKSDCSLKKEDPDSFAKKYPELRDISKVVALSATYGTTAPKLAPEIKKNIHEAQMVLDNYFLKFPDVAKFMTDSHKQAMTNGVVYNLFGRPRRMPEALKITKDYGEDVTHEQLPYALRNLLNLSVNHRIQSTGASIMNRAAIQVCSTIKELSKENPLWKEVKIVLQVHDELVLESPGELSEDTKLILKHCMENCVQLPRVKLVADPVVSNTLAGLKQ